MADNNSSLVYVYTRFRRRSSIRAGRAVYDTRLEPRVLKPEQSVQPRSGAGEPSLKTDLDTFRSAAAALR